MDGSTFKIYNASAGSGKTYTLVKDYLKIVLTSQGKSTKSATFSLTPRKYMVHGETTTNIKLAESSLPQEIKQVKITNSASGNFRKKFIFSLFCLLTCRN